MSALHLVAPELVLHVNERQQFRRTFAHFGRRALRRRLSAVAARLERTASYQSSLERVLAAGAQHQRTLDEAQRTSWLTLEDALHDHAWRSNRAFFRAGVELGSQLAHARQSSVHQRRPRKCQPASAPPNSAAAEMNIIVSLLEIIHRLLER